MKKKILFIFLTLFSVYIFAQIPDWDWAVNSGGIYRDLGQGICADNEGNILVTGFYSDVGNFGNYYVTSNGGKDIFIVKIDSNGEFIWVESVGGIGWDEGNAITTDNNGNIYITGRFNNTVNFGDYELTTHGGNDIFIAKMDTNGTWLWAVCAGGLYWDEAFALSVDEDENVYVTGCYTGTSYFGSFIYSTISIYDDNIFVAKLDINGNWIWVKDAGGGGWDRGTGISLGIDNHVYVTGYFGGLVYFGTIQPSYYGAHDIFVAKIDIEGNWIWVITAGGIGFDDPKDLCTDNNGNIYITGSFEDSAIFGNYSIINNSLAPGLEDIFVAKLDNNGTWLWATSAGGDYMDIANSITIDINQNVFITGYFLSEANFGYLNIINPSTEYADIFVAKLDNSGNWDWVLSAGGNSTDIGLGIFADINNQLYVTGRFEDTANFGYNLINATDYYDVFITKLNTGTSTDQKIITPDFSLRNSPNPFNPSTTIEFSILNDSEIELSVYNIKGQKIKTLANNQFTKGSHSIVWNGDDEFGKMVSSGIYYYQLNVDGKIEAVKKCLLLK